MDRRLFIAVALAACSSKPEPVPPKAPNNELIVGAFERHPPDGETAMVFDIDGKFRLAKNKSELERTPYAAEGTYKLEGDQLTFTNEKGACADKPATKVGTYKVVISKIGIRWIKVTDSCERRLSMDGPTGWRVT